MPKKVVMLFICFSIIVAMIIPLNAAYDAPFVPGWSNESGNVQTSYHAEVFIDNEPFIVEISREEFDLIYTTNQFGTAPWDASAYSPVFILRLVGWFLSIITIITFRVYS